MLNAFHRKQLQRILHILYSTVLRSKKFQLMSPRDMENFRNLLHTKEGIGNI